MNTSKGPKTGGNLQHLEDFLQQQKIILDKEIRTAEDQKDFIDVYNLGYKRELKFYNKVYEQSERFIIKHKNPVLLFDIDDTITTRLDHKDFIRPGFIFVATVLKKRYPEVKIGILSARWIESCIPPGTESIIDKDFVFSSRLHNDERYTYKAGKKYEKSNSSNGYINKMNAYTEIENNDKNHQFLLIDDILRSENTPIEKQGKAIDVYECAFLVDILGLTEETAKALLQNLNSQENITKEELANILMTTEYNKWRKVVEE